MQIQNSKKKMVAVITVAIVLIGVTFYAGYTMGKRPNTERLGNNQGQMMGMQGGMRNRGMNGGMGGFINGEVLSKDATSLTIKMRDGSSKIVLYSDATQVMKSTSGSATDVSVGSQVTITGKANSDGSLTAQSVQIRPAMPAPVQ